MTEKDAIRWEGSAALARFLPAAYALRMELQFSQGLEHWQRLMEMVVTLARNR
jgi:hypothetical protein